MRKRRKRGLNRVKRRDLHWVILSFSPAKLFLLSNSQQPAPDHPLLRCCHTDTLPLHMLPPLSGTFSPSTLPLRLPVNTPHPSNAGVPLQTPLSGKLPAPPHPLSPASG